MCGPEITSNRNPSALPTYAAYIRATLGARAQHVQLELVLGLGCGVCVDKDLAGRHRLARAVATHTCLISLEWAKEHDSAPKSCK